MMLRSIRRLATLAPEASTIASASAASSSSSSSLPSTTTTTTTTTTPIKSSSEPSLHFEQPPSYTLAQLRDFPSLAPQSFIPLPTWFFRTEQPTRRDLLWNAVVYEADADRVGSNYVTLKSDKPYSGRKLRPQKGTGRARLGTGNSPHLDNEVKAHAIKGPHDWSTDLNKKQYDQAMQVALTSQYKQGNLFVTQNECQFKQSNLEVAQSFVSTHRLEQLSMLFITDGERENLSQSMRQFFISDKKLENLSKPEKIKALRKLKGRVLSKEEVQVRDILKANRVFVERPALEWLIAKYDGQ